MSKVIVEVPIIQGFHADPDDFQRYTLPGLGVLMGAFEELDRGALSGPSSALALVLKDWLASWVPRQHFPRGHRVTRILVSRLGNFLDSLRRCPY